MAEVDAVERADCDAPTRLGQLVGDAGDVHATPAAMAARTSASLSRRSGVKASGVTASATENGPTSVRRSDTQCPPSASAIARMYVPEVTERSRMATPSS